MCLPPSLQPMEPVPALPLSSAEKKASVGAKSKTSITAHFASTSEEKKAPVAAIPKPNVVPRVPLRPLFDLVPFQNPTISRRAVLTGGKQGDVAVHSCEQQLGVMLGDAPVLIEIKMVAECHALDHLSLKRACDSLAQVANNALPEAHRVVTSMPTFPQFSSM
eukprot:TRINITY_DN1269_c0_g2_i3.p3 TRINITY_DN1269_c0_g2~~TRINITY_DN1269_c0_g2_i3.p3  ORF type:complete len:163 (+),score=27.92 TRINITY_DN1269_c0_g2_i3:4751-5239(+)